MNEREEGQEVDAGGTAMPSVGARLRAAREASGLSPADVANALKFAPRQIEALEADDYAALPGAIYVRGFVRNYARFLKLDPAPLLARLDEDLPAPRVEVKAPTNMGEADESGGRSTQGLRWGMVVLLLGAGAFAAWHFFVAQPSKDGPTSVAVPSGEASSVSANAPILPATAASTSSQATAAEEQPAAVMAGAAALRFSFSGKSWLEVVDGQGKSLFRGENAPGSQLELSGQPPFDLVIGNARTVTLTYREQPVDLSPHIRAEVARLRLE